MSDADNPTPTEPNQPAPRRRWRRRWMFAGGLGLAALAGLFASRGFAHGHGFGRWSRPHTQEQLRERLDWGADRALARVAATDVQRQRVDAILDQAAPELFATHQKGHAIRDQFVRALASGDRTGSENARRQALAWADEVSKLWLSVVERSLAVLDDGQRAKVREHIEHMASRHHHGRHD
jgi:hypothetical protein